MSESATSRPASVIVYSDYVCPFCLFAKEILDEVTAGTRIDMEWRPFELRPYPTPTLRPEGDYLQRVWRDVVFPMARELNVNIVLPQISPQPYTHIAFEGYQYARKHGVGTDYNASMLRAFFQEERDIGKPEVVADIGAEMGLDRRDFHEALVTRRYEDDHKHAIADARADQIRAVPTIIVGTHRIEGLPKKETLAMLIDQRL